jgi:NAD-dependent deacetylase
MLNRRILIITGAGVSAESGIPTFRGKDGYWRNHDPAKLATPEAFQRDPQLVWEWYHERRATIRGAQPNAAHVAITKLAIECAEFLLVTQNVDDLHTRAEYAGQTILPHQIVQIHGDIFLTRCSRCNHHYRELDAERIALPLCHKCKALMRPGVVWFGESLDVENLERVEAFLSRGSCDHVFVIGTTAMFGYIVDWAVGAAGDGGELVEINPDVTSLTQLATRSVREPAGAVLPNLLDDLIGGNA